MNLDTGLTPQEEEELLLGTEDVELELEEDAGKILDEGPLWAMERDQEIPVPIPIIHDPRDPLRLAGLATSTPIKEFEDAKSSLFCDTSSSRSPDSGLGGFRAPPPDMVQNQIGNENKAESKRSRKNTTTPKGVPMTEGPVGPHGKKKDAGLEDFATQKLYKAQKRKRPNQTPGPKIAEQPKNCGSVTNQTPEPELIELEDGEISPVSKRDQERPDKMGKTLSLPKVLRTVADALEEGELEDSPSSPGPDTPGHSGGASAGPQPAKKAWKKNGGRNAKGRAAAGPVDEGTGKPEGRGRSRPLLPFNDRKFKSLPDLEDLYYHGRTYEWRKRGGSLGRGVGSHPETSARR